MDPTFEIVLILLPLSFISERIANILKLILPSRWTGNLKVKEANPEDEKKRELKILLVSLLAGEIVAFGTGANLFTLFQEGASAWGYDWTFKWFFGCLFTGFFLSWGSKFWHDLLDILLEVKYARKAANASKETQNQLEKARLAVAIQEGGLEHELGSPSHAPTGEKVAVSEDQKTLDRLSLLHPKLRAEAGAIYREIREKGVSIRVTDTLRTFAEQDKLYSQGRDAPGKIVTHVKGGRSYHNYGLALDFCLLLDGGKKASWDRTLDLDKDQLNDWDEVVAIFKHYGWEWGGDWTRFKDYPHFQKTYGLSTSQLWAKHEAGDFSEGNYLRL